MNNIVKPCYPLEEPAPTKAIKKGSLQQASARKNLNHSSTFVCRWAALSFLLGRVRAFLSVSRQFLSVFGPLPRPKYPPSTGIPPIKGIRVSCQMRYDVYSNRLKGGHIRDLGFRSWGVL